MSNIKGTKSLREVRAWKDVCAREVAGMEIGAAVRKRLKDSAVASERLGFHVPVRRVSAVAEPKATYGRKQDNR